MLKAQFAGLNIAMETRFPRMERFCRDYLIDEDAAVEFTAAPSLEEISDEGDKKMPGRYPMDYLETLAIQRQISERLPFYQRMLMHGAVIAFQGKGYMFSAVSGTGKSTHIALWKKYLGNQVEIINGDKPFLHVKKDQVLVCGTPWAGKEGWNVNRTVSLAGICFLQRGKKNQIHRLEPQDSLQHFLTQIYMPENMEAAGMTLELLDMLLKNVPLYLLECDISEKAVQTSFERMTGCLFEEYSQ